MNTIEKHEPVVSIGIDAAVVAAHQVAIRGPGVAEDFRVRPTLAGLEELTVRLADWAPAMVVAEPTAGTWLPLLHAITESGVSGWVRGQPRFGPASQSDCGGEQDRRDRRRPVGS